MSDLAPINAGDSRLINLRLMADGVQLTLAEILTLTFTLRDVRTGGVINSRTNQNVKNANNVTVAVDGAIAWSAQAEDCIIVNRTIENETHRLLVRCTYAGGVGSGEIDIVINNTEKLA
jgi:hypothetical protein